MSYLGHSLWGGVLPLCRAAVGVFYSPWRLEVTFCYSDPSKRPSANDGVKYSQAVIIIICKHTHTLIYIYIYIISFSLLMVGNTNSQCYILLYRSCQTFCLTDLESTTSRHVNSRSTIHFNNCISWLEIRVQTLRVSIGTFFYITIYISLYIYIYIYICTYTYIHICPVGWGSRIHRLLLCRGIRPPPNECPGYDTKQSDSEVPVMLEF